MCAGVAAGAGAGAGDAGLGDSSRFRPKIHSLVHGVNQVGLTKILTAEDLTDEVIENNIQQNMYGTLDILTSGDRTVNPAGLLNSEEMRRLMERLTEKYDHIVIDSPPILYFADAMILSTLTDVVTVVVRDNYSSRQAVLQVKKVLQTIGANIVGIVMNGVPLRWSAYYKYRDYEIGGEPPPIEGEQEILKLG